MKSALELLKVINKSEVYPYTVGLGTITFDTDGHFRLKAKVMLGQVIDSQYKMRVIRNYNLLSGGEFLRNMVDYIALSHVISPYS